MREGEGKGKWSEEEGIDMTAASQQGKKKLIRVNRKTPSNSKLVGYKWSFQSLSICFNNALHRGSED